MYEPLQPLTNFEASLLFARALIPTEPYKSFDSPLPRGAFTLEVLQEFGHVLVGFEEDPGDNRSVHFTRRSLLKPLKSSFSGRICAVILREVAMNRSSPLTWTGGEGG
jgi:hypothetical protein